VLLQLCTPTDIAPIEGIIALASTIKDMRALSTLIFGGDTYNGKFLGYGKYEQITPVPATLGSMTEADFSNKHLGPGDACIISAWISHRDNGTMTKLDISSNDLRAEGGKALAAGLKGNQVITELNISGNMLGKNSGSGDDTSAGVIAIADAIPDMGALSELDAACNDMFGQRDRTGITAWAAALKASTSITKLNLNDNVIDTEDAKILAPAISDMGVLLTIIVHNWSPLPIQDMKTKAELDLSRKSLNHLDAIIIAALLPLNVSAQLYVWLSLLSLISF
jgi:hypothetical protein